MTNLLTELYLAKDTEVLITNSNDIVVDGYYLLTTDERGEAEVFSTYIKQLNDLFGKMVRTFFPTGGFIITPDATFEVGGKDSDIVSCEGYHVKVRDPQHLADKEDLEEFVNDILVPALNTNRDEEIVQEELNDKWVRRLEARKSTSVH